MFALQQATNDELDMKLAIPKVDKTKWNHNKIRKLEQQNDYT
jgi:hypothetical protein